MTKHRATDLLVLISFFLSCLSLHGQDFASDIKQINTTYQQIKEVDLKISYLLYANSTSTRPMEKEVVELKQKGNLHLSRRGDMESLNNEEYLIMVDHEDKTISVQAPIETASPFSSYPIPIDSLMPLYDSIHYEVLGADKSKYSLYISDFMYEKIELFFHPKNYLIQQVVFYGAEEEALDNSSKMGKPRYEIRYDKTLLRPNFGSNTFSSSKYIEMREGKMYCTNSYKHYQLINYLQ